MKPNVAPTAAFSAVPTDLTVAVDGGGSADVDGQVVSYAWDFGDGSTGSGVTASHTYAVAGTYPVVLTVTDDRGCYGSPDQGGHGREAECGADGGVLGGADGFDGGG